MEQLESQLLTLQREWEVVMEGKRKARSESVGLLENVRETLQSFGGRLAEQEAAQRELSRRLEQMERELTGESGESEAPPPPPAAPPAAILSPPAREGRSLASSLQNTVTVTLNVLREA